MSGSLNMYTEKTMRVKEIHFSVMSPEEILQRSVVEVTKAETYLGSEACQNGLFDIRMGTLDNGKICPTDELDSKHSPGYFGHITLAKPVFFVQFMRWVTDTLRLVCYRCANLLLDKNRITFKDLSRILRFLKRHKIRVETTKLVELHRLTKCTHCDAFQPDKYTRQDLLIQAVFKANRDANGTFSPPRTFNISAEYVNLLFKRMSQRDVELLGFACRPEWMICTVLPVLPPIARPSVTMDGVQRSEDDLTHKLVDIVKSNRDLQRKIASGAEQDTIDTYLSILQYHVATMVDNDISQINPAAQRSGRPVKALRQRIKGKEGRIRGNLMGKRVDFSARTVITPDPLLQLDELGVPLEICMNMTIPEVVTISNYHRLQRYVRNGPNAYPGAKSLYTAKDNCFNYLKYANLEARSNALEVGDVVCRHLIPGDAVLFNRQPSLHRMSMMCHRLKPMPGCTFRLCPDVTTPYNADFDGDEMNMHVPQSTETTNELLTLTSVALHLISPSTSKPVVGIVQDTLLGASLLPLDGEAFPRRDVMNLVLWNSNSSLLVPFVQSILSTPSKTFYSGKDVLSLILSKELNIDSKNLKIVQGKFEDGVLVKGAIKNESYGLVHVCVNDLGAYQAKMNIDNLRFLVTLYILHKGFSIGISDMIVPTSLEQQNEDTILKHLEERDSICAKMHDYNDKSSTEIFFEISFQAFENKMSSQKVVDILGNGTREGLKHTNNRLVQMVKAGSKGSDLNISQIIACVGQQSVDGKRITFYNHRALPTFIKHDHSPCPRGFVASSFMKGLKPSEVFFHAMGGREGLIDTAVKTSATGYLQRRQMKLLEDVSIRYDLTVRDVGNRVVQMFYGGDNLDPVKTEFVLFPFVIAPGSNIRDTIEKKMDFSESVFETGVSISTPTSTLTFLSNVREKYFKNKEQVDVKLKEIKGQLVSTVEKWVKNLVKRTGTLSETTILFPAHFERILVNVQAQQTTHQDLVVETHMDCALEVLDDLHDLYTELSKFIGCSEMLYIMLYGYLGPTEVLVKRTLSKTAWKQAIQCVKDSFLKSRIEPGDMVGVIAAQSIGEPATQLTLNTFHFAGVGQKSNVTRGVPRINELLNLTHSPKTQSLTIALHPSISDDASKALVACSLLKTVKLENIVTDLKYLFDPVRGWIITLDMQKTALLDEDMTTTDILAALQREIIEFEMKVSCSHMNDESDCITFVLEFNHPEQFTHDGFVQLRSLDKTVLSKLNLKGTSLTQNVSLRKTERIKVTEDGTVVSIPDYVIDSDGSNLSSVMIHPYVDGSRTITNDVWEAYSVLGIEGARTVLIREITDVISDGSYVNPKHISLLVEMMTQTGYPISVDRHGFSRGDIGPLAKCSFEESDLQIYKAALFGESDTIQGVSSNIMCGQVARGGSGSVDVIFDEQSVSTLLSKYSKFPPEDPFLDEFQERLWKSQLSKPSLSKEQEQFSDGAADSFSMKELEDALQFDDF
jgi:DNA-directed RNA polymerase II subunit RPB1